MSASILVGSDPADYGEKASRLVTDANLRAYSARIWKSTYELIYKDVGLMSDVFVECLSEAVGDPTLTPVERQPRRAEDGRQSFREQT